MGNFVEKLSPLIKSYRKIDDAAGKKFFGNTSGFKKNFTGSSKLNTKILSAELKEKDLELYTLLSEHVLVIKCPFEASLIEKIKQKYLKMMDDDEFSWISVAVDEKPFIRTIYQATKNIPEIAELVNEKIIHLLKNYYSSGNFSVLNVDLRRHYHVPPEIDPKLELFGLLWHCDQRSTEQIKLFVYLSDVTDEDGPFHAIKQNRTKELMKMGFDKPTDYKLDGKLLEDPNYIVKATGDTGTTFFGNPNTLLHKAGNPAIGHIRDVLCITFQSAKTPSNDLFKNVKPIGVERLEIEKRMKK